MNNSSLSLFLILITLIFFGCSENKVVGGCTETSNQAIIYNADGSPADGACVVFIPVDYVPNSSDEIFIDSTKADNNGKYFFSSLNNGVYNVWFKKNNNFAFRGNLSVNDGVVDEDIIDTLSIPGEITGIVRLLPEHDSREVFILLLGSERYTSPIDSIGNFKFENIPEGEYNIRCLTSYEGYGYLDTTIIVTEDLNAIIEDTLYLPYLRLPVPDSVEIRYDSLTQVMNLSWSCDDNENIYGYNIYRKNIYEDRFHLVNIEPIINKTFIDSSLVYSLVLKIENGTTCQYKISAVDSLGVVGNGMISNNVIINSVYKQIEEAAVDSIGIFGEGNLEYGIDGKVYYVSSRVPIVRVINPNNFNDQKEIIIPDSAHPYDISQLTDSTLVIATNNGVYHLNSGGNFLYWYNLSLIEFDTHGDSCIYYTTREVQQKYQNIIVCFNMKTGKFKSTKLILNNDSSNYDISGINIHGDSMLVGLKNFDRYQFVNINLVDNVKTKLLKLPAQGIIFDFVFMNNNLITLGERFISCYKDGKIESRCQVENQMHLVSISLNKHITIGSHGTIKRYEY